MPWTSIFAYSGNPRDFTAIKLGQCMSNFFVVEARRSSHKFLSGKEVKKALICNYQPTYTGNKDCGAYPLSFTIYLEIVLSIKSTNQKHGGFDVTVSLFSWGHPLTTAHA